MLNGRKCHYNWRVSSLIAGRPFLFRLNNKKMSRRPGNPVRRLADGGSLPFAGSMHSKSRSSPLLSVGLVVVVIFNAL